MRVGWALVREWWGGRGAEGERGARELSGSRADAIGTLRVGTEVIPAVEATGKRQGLASRPAVNVVCGAGASRRLGGQPLALARGGDRRNHRQLHQ